VKDYLVSERIQYGKAKIFNITDITVNYFIAKSCLLYILHYDKSDSKIIFTDDLKYFPLLQYACEFWHIHAKSIPMGCRISIKGKERVTVIQPTSPPTAKAFTSLIYYFARLFLPLTDTIMVEMFPKAGQIS
jgi:hypothetical protein